MVRNLTHIITVFIVAVISTGCTDRAMAEAPLPNQPTVAIENYDGKRVLKDWSAQKATALGMKDRATPDNPVFAGAETWIIAVNQTNLDTATREAFVAAGMSNIKILASESGNPAAMQVLHAHPQAKQASVMLEGSLDGTKARGIALVILGNADGGAPETASVHGFMAPIPIFEALGGMAVLGVLHLHGQTSPQENMLEDGKLSPVVASRKLNSFFAAWVQAYVIPMMATSMQIQQQSIQNMQSWNNSMNACAGDPSCSVVPMNDGSGGWTTRQQ